jgi:hypothetical protein
MASKAAELHSKTPVLGGRLARRPLLSLSTSYVSLLRVLLVACLSKLIIGALNSAGKPR